MTTSTKVLSFNSDIDYTNIDDITASINACALEIESLPESISQQSKNTKSPLQLPCSSPEEETEDSDSNSNLCYFKTKSGGYKAYELSLTEESINFCRPKSTKQQEMTYGLNTVQCLIRYTAREDSRVESKSSSNIITGEFCINLLTSTSHQRSIYFASEDSMKHWHEEILTAQGFWEQRINQYEPVAKLGEGSFGVVILSQHKNTGAKVAVKVIQKGTIDKVYKKNNQ